MILFNDTTYLPGATIQDALAWVANCNILGGRTTMEGVVQKSLLANQPDWRPYDSKSYYGVPYNSESEDSPAKQFYDYLMTIPEFVNGTQYPPIE